MDSHINQLKEIYCLDGSQGFVDTYLDGVRFFWCTEEVERSPLIYDSGIVIIGNGHKIGYLEEEVFRYDEENYLVMSVPIPFECASYATEDDPLLGIFIDVDVGHLHELINLASKHRELERFSITSARRGIEPVKLNEEMRAATERLMACLCSPLESEALGPLLVKEVIYRALMDSHGPVLYTLTQRDASYARVAKAISRIRRSYAEPLTVDSLANDANMSVSGFHRAFKKITGSSPLQYLKKIRLHKAKSLIVNENVPVGIAASRVGYESSSQFSREFKRYFEVAPTDSKGIGYTDPMK